MIILLKYLFFIFIFLSYNPFCKAKKELIESVVAIVNEQPIFYSNLQKLEKKMKEEDLIFIDGTVLMTVDREKIKNEKKNTVGFYD